MRSDLGYDVSEGTMRVRVESELRYDESKGTIRVRAS